MFQIIVPRLILLLFVTAWLVLALAPLLPCSMWLAELNFKYCQGSTRLFPNVIVRHVIWTVLQSTNIVIQLTYCCAASQEDSIATLITQVWAPMYYLVHSLPRPWIMSIKVMHRGIFYCLSRTFFVWGPLSRVLFIPACALTRLRESLRLYEVR